jgi:hypothetical protein
MAPIRSVKSTYAMARMAAAYPRGSVWRSMAAIRSTSLWRATRYDSVNHTAMVRPTSDGAMPSVSAMRRRSSHIGRTVGP